MLIIVSMWPLVRMAGRAIAGALAAATYVQIGYWKNRVTLFEHGRTVTRDNWIAMRNLGRHGPHADRPYGGDPALAVPRSQVPRSPFPVPRSQFPVTAP